MKKRLHDNNANLKQYADRFKAEQPFVSFTTRPMEHCIVYFSSSISLFQETDLISLLQQSRSHNVTAGITGILLINQGSIVQVLEGRQETIKALYKQIEKDQRHTDVIKIVDCPIKERLFARWSMGCKSITNHQLELIKTIVDLGEVDWLLAKPSTNSIVNVLKSAYQSDLHYLQRVSDPIVPNLLHNHIQEWKQHYRHLAQAVESIENEFKKRSIDLKEREVVSLKSSQEQQIEEIMHYFESSRLLTWERQQRELGQNFILV
ncbi:BLUF domain-containing protein [Nostoc sp. CHAB 5834]|nr:BLUF domain-containing protein [Nostoc sp. CHAB 5834]